MVYLRIGDSASCISEFIELVIELEKINGNKLFFINVIENTINHPSWHDGYKDERLELLLDKIKIMN